MSDEQDYDPDELYCLCRKPYSPSQFMIECDVCKDWFHGSCVGIEEHQGNDIDTYHCPRCVPKHGPLVLKRRRNWHRHDYSEINDGKKAIQSGTLAFVHKLKERDFSNLDDVLKRMKGSDLTIDYLEEHGFDYPILVENKDDLGLRVPPPSFKISDIERCVGPMRELDVIDVARQEDIKMKMREWTEYYEVIRPRKKVLNVISLEFSDTELSKYVTPPKVVREMDWIEVYWPEELPPDCLYNRPQVQKYCLMGVKDSYTDFHVDFGGTSVWYHVVRGEKVFYFIKPTNLNLMKYEQWVSSATQSEVFFGDLVDDCYMCPVLPGNTLFIPTGWIHAVLTPEDSLVFGGNFLQRYSISQQLKVYELELRLDTPTKFLHPSYECLTWYAAQGLLDELQGYTKELPPPIHLLNGLAYLVVVLSSWIKSRQAYKDKVPENLDPIVLIQQLTKALAVAIVKFRSSIASDKLQFEINKNVVILIKNKGPKPTTNKRRRGMMENKKSKGYQRRHKMEDSDMSGDNEEVEEEKQKRKSVSDDDVSDEDYRSSEDEEDDQDAYVILNEDDEMTPRKKRRSKTEDDDLWMPGGTVKLLSGSIASGSRPSRPHARKHSVDKKTTKIAMAKWVKKQGYTSTEEKPDIKYLESMYGAPVISGGALVGPTANSGESSSQLMMNRNRATAAATAVNLALESSRLKLKPQTSKQRLGKILGLDKSGVSSGWK
ncbi:lysine-specific demethylase 7B-like [Dysidea avara]|uniref:lysine-specific demethylase 7B-like n=1 Tax=Dysidea avara TaxID=196820 RepID=UPI003321BBAB